MPLDPSSRQPIGRREGNTNPVNHLDSAGAMPHHVDNDHFRGVMTNSDPVNISDVNMATQHTGANAQMNLPRANPYDPQSTLNTLRINIADGFDHLGFMRNPPYDEHTHVNNVIAVNSHTRSNANHHVASFHDNFSTNVDNSTPTYTATSSDMAEERTIDLYDLDINKNITARQRKVNRDGEQYTLFHQEHYISNANNSMPPSNATVGDVAEDGHGNDEGADDTASNGNAAAVEDEDQKGKENSRAERSKYPKTKVRFMNGRWEGRWDDLRLDWDPIILLKDYLAKIGPEQGEYEHPTAVGKRGLNDSTRFLAAHKSWGEDRGHRPDILFAYKRPKKWPKRTGKPEYVTDRVHGRDGRDRYVVDNVTLRPLKAFENIPLAISTEIEGWRMEAIAREDSRIGYEDFRARMISLVEIGKAKPTDEEEKELDARPSAHTLQMRTKRFRERARCPSWQEKKELTKVEQEVVEEMTHDMRKNNSTRDLKDADSPEERKALDQLAGGSCPQRAPEGRALPEAVRDEKRKRASELVASRQAKRLKTATNSDAKSSTVDDQNHVATPNQPTDAEFNHQQHSTGGRRQGSIQLPGEVLQSSSRAQQEGSQQRNIQQREQQVDRQKEGPARKRKYNVDAGEQQEKRARRRKSLEIHGRPENEASDSVVGFAEVMPQASSMPSQYPVGPLDEANLGNQLHGPLSTSTTPGGYLGNRPQPTEGAAKRQRKSKSRPRSNAPLQHSATSYIGAQDQSNQASYGGGQYPSMPNVNQETAGIQTIDPSLHIMGLYGESTANANVPQSREYPIAGLGEPHREGFVSQGPPRQRQPVNSYGYENSDAAFDDSVDSGIEDDGALPQRPYANLTQGPLGQTSFQATQSESIGRQASVRISDMESMTTVQQDRTIAPAQLTCDHGFNYPSVDADDCRAHNPRSQQEKLAVFDALEQTRQSYLLLTSTTAPDTDETCCYLEQWFQLQMAYRQWVDSTHPGRDVEPLFQLDKWSGGVHSWESAGNAWPKDLSDDAREFVSELVFHYGAPQ